MRKRRGLNVEGIEQLQGRTFLLILLCEKFSANILNKPVGTNQSSLFTMGKRKMNTLSLPGIVEEECVQGFVL